jgi:hypothetical protein
LSENQNIFFRWPNMDIFSLIAQSDIVIINKLSQCDVKHIMTLTIKTL